MCRCTCLSVCMHGMRRGCWVSPSYSVYSSEAVSLPEPRGLYFFWQAEGSRLGGSVLGLPWRWNSGVHTEIPVYYLCAGIRTLHLITDSYPLSISPLVLYFLFLCICLFHVHADKQACTWPWPEGGGQKTTFQSQFSPSTMWVMGIKLRWTGWAASAFIYWTISLSCHLFSWRQPQTGMR